MRYLLPLICYSMWLSFSVADICSQLPGYSTYGNSCYKLFTEEKTWAAAEASCVADGGHLASIHSSEEQAFINSLLSDGIWIGLSGTKSTMAWSDKTQLDYEDWHGINPDESGEACVMVKLSYSFRWADRPCTLTRQYMCRSDMVKHEAQVYFTKIPTGVPVDATVNPSSTQAVRSSIECARRCQQDGDCVHFIMNEDRGEYFCEIYTILKRPPTASPPTNNYQKIIS